jgi:hypothetical protein
MTQVLQSLLNKLALISFVWFLCGASIYALETNLLSDPKIVQALQEDEIEITKVEKIYTDVNISKSKKNYTIVVAKAKIPKVENLGNNELKNAFNPWRTFGFCLYTQGNKANNLHILIVILNNKKALDAILYERNIKVSLETGVNLAFDSAKNYPNLADLHDRTMFLLSSDGCDTIRYFYMYSDNGARGYNFFTDLEYD